jgi:hypothetical protein
MSRATSSAELDGARPFDPALAHRTSVRYDGSMAFAKQPSGPPASSKQVAYLQALLRAAGYADFREARHPLGFTQRQAGGKFTSAEASALIEQLLDNPAEQEPATARRPPDEASSVRTSSTPVADDRGLGDVTDEVLASELRRRGWEVQRPALRRSA